MYCGHEGGCEQSRVSQHAKQCATDLLNHFVAFSGCLDRCPLKDRLSEQSLEFGSQTLLKTDNQRVANARHHRQTHELATQDAGVVLTHSHHQPLILLIHRIGATTGNTQRKGGGPVDVLWVRKSTTLTKLKK
jgi:hypothetical protein